MSDTQQLIVALSADARPVMPMMVPSRLALRLSALLAAYALVMALMLGLREDIGTYWHQPVYLTELLALFALAAASITASVFRAFPDQYQYDTVRHLPAVAFAVFFALLAFQFWLPGTPSPVNAHGMECAICIGAVAIIPSAIAMYLIRKGASTKPLLSGMYAVLACAAIGCLVLRLIEANDGPTHLLLWHYFPTLGFAALGGIAGKFLLKW